MKTRTLEGEKIQVDSRGYLRNPDDWNEKTALALARREGIAELSREQLTLLRTLRAYYSKNKTYPMLDHVCRLSEQPRRCLYNEFTNPELAFKIAGLPRQENLHFYSFDGKTYHMETCC